jgi:hypothetical protein
VHVLALSAQLRSACPAAKVFHRYCEPAQMKKIARSMRQHRELALNYFRAQKPLSGGGVEA